MTSRPSGLAASAPDHCLVPRVQVENRTHLRGHLLDHRRRRRHRDGVGHHVDPVALLRPAPSRPPSASRSCSRSPGCGSCTSTGCTWLATQRCEPWIHRPASPVRSPSWASSPGPAPGCSTSRSAARLTLNGEVAVGTRSPRWRSSSSAAAPLPRLAHHRPGATGRYVRDVLVIGTNAEAADLVSLFSDHTELGFRVAGVLGDRDEAIVHDLGKLWSGSPADAPRGPRRPQGHGRGRGDGHAGRPRPSPTSSGCCTPPAAPCRHLVGATPDRPPPPARPTARLRAAVLRRAVGAPPPTAHHEAGHRPGRGRGTVLVLAAPLMLLIALLKSSCRTGGRCCSRGPGSAPTASCSRSTSSAPWWWTPRPASPPWPGRTSATAPSSRWPPIPGSPGWAASARPPRVHQAARRSCNRPPRHGPSTRACWAEAAGLFDEELR